MKLSCLCKQSRKLCMLSLGSPRYACFEPSHYRAFVLCVCWCPLQMCGDQRRTSDALHSITLPLFLWDEFFTELGCLFFSHREPPPCSPSLELQARAAICSFYVGVWDLKSGLYACVTGTLSYLLSHRPSPRWRFYLSYSFFLSIHWLLSKHR